MCLCIVSPLSIDCHSHRLTGKSLFQLYQYRIRSATRPCTGLRGRINKMVTIALHQHDKPATEGRLGWVHGSFSPPGRTGPKMR
jgi:hypothetical protein